MTDEQKISLKQQLKDACITVLEDRIKTSEQGMKAAQESANSDEKSSAGDKYETTRAMAHIEKEMNARQLLAAKQELDALVLLNVSTLCVQVTTGAVVICKEQTYFVALGLGRTTINGQKVTLLSPLSPIAIALHLKKAGDSIVFNGTTEEIVEVF